MVVDLDPAAAEIAKIQREQREQGLAIPNDIKALTIFKTLPLPLRRTIVKISEVFFRPIPGRGPLSPPPPPPQQLSPEQLIKIQLCFKYFIGISSRDNFTNLTDLLQKIIMPSIEILSDGSIVIVKDVIQIGYQQHTSPLYRLIRTLESGIYRHLLMSSMLDEFTEMKSYPLNITLELGVNPRVSCAFLNSDGQYVELPGGFGAGSLGDYDFSGIFQHLSFNPYIFSATRKSMTFPAATLENYILNPQRVNAERAAREATIPVKVHNKMFLVRLIFSTTTGAIQIVVCVSSTICVASPNDGQAPYIPFGVDVQFNVVSIGPLRVGEGGSMSTDATILATMSDYLSLGCMVAAKKGEYSITSGYAQFFDYFDYFFKPINTECFTYVSAYMSPFNCGKDLIMKHFGRVFENYGDNDISAAIRGRWEWIQYLPIVQPEVCSKDNGVDRLLTPAMLEEAITSGRRNMQVVVQVFFDPIMGIEDGQAVGDETGDVASEIGSATSSPARSESGSSVTSSLGSSGSERLVQGVFGKDSLPSSMNSDQSWTESMGSQGMGSRDSASSVEPVSPRRGSPIRMGSGDGSRGGTNKKTRKRKYRTNRRSKSKPKHSNMRRRIRMQTRTQKNTHVSRTKTKTKTKTRTIKIKSKKFPKRIYLYSTPRTAQRMAYKYLGRTKTAKLYPARNPAKKYMVYDPKNNKWVNFGQMGYEDYTKHHDKTRRKNYLTRTKGMLGDWKSNKYSANNLSRRILWS